MPKGLAYWSDFLSNKPLPILAQTKKKVQWLIDQSQLSITQYTAPIYYDAGFAAYVFRHVNSSRKSSNKNALTTMANALSHLGQKAFQEILNKAPLLENLELGDKQQKGYIGVVGQACHASMQSREWAMQRSVVETEETQFAALLQSVPELMLWCYGDNIMLEIEDLCYVQKKDYEQAAEIVLGCKIRELGEKLSEIWNLPEMVIAGLNSKLDNFTLATGVSLASELARLVSYSWYGKDTVEVISKIAKYKGKAEGEIERQLHMGAVNANDILIEKGFAAPAKLLFQLVDEDYIDPQYIFNKVEVEKNITVNKVMSEPLVEVKSVEKKVNDSAIKKQNEVNDKKLPDARKAILEKIKARKKAEVLQENKPKDIKKLPINIAFESAVKDLKKMVVNGDSASGLIEKSINICLLFGAERCVFMVKVKGKDLLVPKYSVENAKNKAINNFKIDLQKPHIFKRLFEKSSSLYLNDENYAKYWPLIPDNVKLSIGVKRFFSGSIFLNERAIGLIYADKVKGELTQEEFKQFKIVCKLLSKGLEMSLSKKVKVKK